MPPGNFTNLLKVFKGNFHYTCGASLDSLVVLRVCGSEFLICLVKSLLLKVSPVGVSAPCQHFKIDLTSVDFSGSVRCVFVSFKQHMTHMQ